MARKEIYFTITDEGRDQGKTFHIRELPALQAERWAMRALSLLARGNVDIGMPTGGMQEIATLGFRALAGIDFADAQPLFDEMLTCIQFSWDKADKARTRPVMWEDDIEEISTLVTLRLEVFKLHVDFFPKGGPSKSQPPTSEPGETASSNTETSPQPSVQFSQSARTKRRR